ncbi:MAG: hypothetical protein M3P93_01285 [Actinomycetota bacterium]|nr:hypothetical protein [Actinomycetota bacterium]
MPESLEQLQETKQRVVHLFELEGRELRMRAGAGLPARPPGSRRCTRPAAPPAQG